MASRTARMLKRQRVNPANRLNSDDETELINSGLLEDGMTKKMKKELLKVLAASREALKVVEPPGPVVASLVSSETADSHSQSPDLFAIDSEVKAGEGSNGNTKASDKTMLIDKRTFEESERVMFYAPVGVDATRYSSVVKRGLNRYYDRLHSFQKKSIDFIAWGSPVVVGDRIKDTIDAIGSRKRPPPKAMDDSATTIKPQRKCVSSSDSDNDISEESSDEQFQVRKRPTLSVTNIWIKANKRRQKKESEKFKSIKVNGLDVIDINEEKEVGSPIKADSGLSVTRNEEVVALEQPAEVACPLCNRMFKPNAIERHASDCADRETRTAQENSDVVQIDSNIDEPEGEVSNISGHCYFCDTNVPVAIHEEHIKSCVGKDKRIGSASLSSMTATEKRFDTLLRRQSNVLCLPNKAEENESRITTKSFYGSSPQPSFSLEVPTNKRSLSVLKTNQNQSGSSRQSKN